MGVTIEGLSRRLVALFVVGLSLAWIVWTLQGLTFSDAGAYRLAAERLVHGANIYVSSPTQDLAFRYAPWFAIAWVPLASLPVVVGNAIWAAMLTAATVFSVLPLARERFLAARLLAVFSAGMLAWTTARGNVHPLVMVALVQGINRRSGPLWIAVAASIKAVPILFTLVYIARREWARAGITLALTAVLVAPMPFMGWTPGAVDPGASLSLAYLVSSSAWALVAGIAVAVAAGMALLAPRYGAIAAATAAVLALPRLLLYDLTYVIVGAQVDPRRR